MRIYTEINWRWTESGLEEEGSSSTQYCGDLSLCGGDSNGGGGGGETDNNSGEAEHQAELEAIRKKWAIKNAALDEEPSLPSTTTAPELPTPDNKTIAGPLTDKEKSQKAADILAEAQSGDYDRTGMSAADIAFYDHMTGTGQNAPTGTGGDTTGSADPVPESTTTVTTPAPAPEDSTIEEEDPDVEQTIGDELAMSRVRRRLRDRFGRRATRGGGAEMAGTGYRLGG